MDVNEQHGEYRRAYVPIAIYHDEADSLEYVRNDEPCVHRRIDETLTLILNMRTRDLVGFQIKGFRHYYLEHRRRISTSSKTEFPRLIEFVEQVMGSLGNRVFEERERLAAYAQAKQIAEQDEVLLSDLPKVA